MYIIKGSKVKAEWLSTKHVALSGYQMKLEGAWTTVVGTVAHLRGDDPVSPTSVCLYVDAEDWTGPLVKPEGCAHQRGHVEVRPEHVVEVL